MFLLGYSWQTLLINCGNFLLTLKLQGCRIFLNTEFQAAVTHQMKTKLKCHFTYNGQGCIVTK